MSLTRNAESRDSPEPNVPGGERHSDGYFSSETFSYCEFLF